MRTFLHCFTFLFLILSFVQAQTPCEFYSINPPSHYNAPGSPGGIDLTDSIASDLQVLGVKAARIEVLHKIYIDSPDID